MQSILLESVAGADGGLGYWHWHLSRQPGTAKHKHRMWKKPGTACEPVTAQRGIKQQMKVSRSQAQPASSH
eukprot:scaffold66462_cov36-Phaeocystis_antarctica.AAC.1